MKLNYILLGLGALALYLVVKRGQDTQAANNAVLYDPGSINPLLNPNNALTGIGSDINSGLNNGLLF